MTTFSHIAFEYIKHRVALLGYTEYQLHFVSKTLNASEVLTIEMSSQLMFILDCSDGLAIESENGVFDKLNNQQQEHQHQHEGFVNITNRLTTGIAFIEYFEVTLIK